VRSISLVALRRLVVAAQGYAGRSRRATIDDVEAAVRALSCVQLDSISTVERSHRIVLGRRVGVHRGDAVTELLRAGRIFEYWAHEACLIPAADWPLFRPAMDVGGRPWWSHVEQTHAHLREEILQRIREEGPLASRDFDGEQKQGMWERKPAKAMLDRLWNHGELVIAGRERFQRLYDLPERVLPSDVLDAPTPTEPERLRALALHAVRARGALTESGIVEHWRLRGGARGVRPVVDGLVADGLLERLRVEDGGPPVLVDTGVDVDAHSPTASVLLSPFDNLLWDRPFARRGLGFDHLIEVYKREHERRYGYYLLPFLRGDWIVGCVDAKSDRAAGELIVKAVHREARVRRSSAFDDALDRALDRLRRVTGLERVRRPATSS
jgi:uncharacterized protein YcaQ